MKAAFRCDATPTLGGGHAMRCLTLANELRKRGDEILFVCSKETLEMVAALGRSGHKLLDAGSTAADAVAEIQGYWSDGADWLIVDSYAIDRIDERVLRAATRRLMVVDDLADRPHDCDLLLDQTHGRAPEDYANLAPAESRLLLGGAYALLRPEFAAGRPLARARRAAGGEARRILVSLGLTDIGGVTARVMRALIAHRLEAMFDVVVGRRAPSLPALQALSQECPALRLHVDAQDIAALMIEADVAIGAGGASSWERCCLGLPTVLIVLADNQKFVAKTLEAQGSAICVGGGDDAPERAVGALTSLMSDRHALENMAQAALRVTNGEGACYVADAMARLPRERP